MRRKAKDGELVVQWSKENNCIGAIWGDGAGHNGTDAHMTFDNWKREVEYTDWEGKKNVDKSFLKELEDRGYDLTTLQFSIMKKQ